MKTLETPIPVKDVVKSVFSDGLKARNMLAGEGRYAMALDVQQFDCNQFIRREAHAKINISVVERASGRPVFQQAYVADKVAGSLITMDAGVFADVEDLKMVANQALQEVVDQALDDPQFRKAVN